MMISVIAHVRINYSIYVYKQLYHPLHRKTSIDQPNSTNVVITMPNALGK